MSSHFTDMFPHAAFLIDEAPAWDENTDTISAPREGPPFLKSLRGYALKSESFPVFNLAEIPERVLIVTSVAAWRELGLPGNDVSATGLYQSLPTGHLAVLLPFCTHSDRRKRSEMWRNYWLTEVQRAMRVAAGTESAAFDWGRCVWGEGADVRAALREILANPQPVAVDVETVGDMPDMQITAIGLAIDGLAVSVPWAGYVSKAFGPQPGCQSAEIKDLVAAILASVAHDKVFHNGAFDRAVFAQLGMPCYGTFEDTILQMKIVFNELYRNLQFAAGMAVRCPAWKDGFKETRKGLLTAARKASGRKKAKKHSLKDWREIPLDALMEYNCHDAAATIMLWRWLAPQVTAFYEGERKYDRLRQLAMMGADQWLYGAAVDQVHRNAVLAESRSQIAALVWEWRKLVGPGVPPYGPGSAEALQNLFFERLKAPAYEISEATKLPSINAFALSRWDTSGRQPLSDIAFTLYRIRKLQKAVQAFLVPVKGVRVYATPNVTGTVGTRFSYRGPNLQQMSKDSKITRFTTGKKVQLAPNIRKLFVAEPGHVLFEADYKALELMAVAYRTNNLEWLRLMAEDADMHVHNVKLMYGIELKRRPDGEWDDPKGIRQVTKVTTYARFYNEKGNPKPVVKLVAPKMPSITEEAVTKVFADFDKGIPHIEKWHRDMKAVDARRGYVETGIGGWRLQCSKTRPDSNRNRSFEVQSTVGEIVCEAMLRLRDLLAVIPGARMLFQVHDSFVVQCRAEDKHRVGRAIKEAMEWLVPELWGHKNIRFPVELSCGQNWADMQKFTSETEEVAA